MKRWWLAGVLAAAAPAAWATEITPDAIRLPVEFLRNNLREAGVTVAGEMIPGSLSLAAALAAMELTFVVSKSLLKDRDFRGLTWNLLLTFVVYGLFWHFITIWATPSSGHHPILVVQGFTRMSGFIYDFGVDPVVVLGHGVMISMALLEAAMAGSSLPFYLEPLSLVFYVLVGIIFLGHCAMALSYFLVFARLWLGVFPAGPLFLAFGMNPVTRPMTSAYFRYLVRTGLLFFFTTLVLNVCNKLILIWVDMALREEFAARPFQFTVMIAIGSLLMAVLSLTLPRVAAAELVPFDLSFGLKSVGG